MSSAINTAAAAIRSPPSRRCAAHRRTAPRTPGQSSGAPGLRQPEQKSGLAAISRRQQLSGGGTGQSQATSRGWRRTSQISTGAPRKALTTIPAVRGHQQAANHVGKQQQGRGGEQGDRQRPAMIGPHQPARHMRIIRPIKRWGRRRRWRCRTGRDDDQADRQVRRRGCRGGGGIVAGLRLFSARLSSSGDPATTTGSRTIFSVCRVRISSEPACRKRS